MKDLWLFIRRFAAPYKGTLALSVLFNIITAFFTIFSFAFLIPILQMLFGLETAHYDFIPWGEGNIKGQSIRRKCIKIKKRSCQDLFIPTQRTRSLIIYLRL